MLKRGRLKVGGCLLVLLLLTAPAWSANSTSRSLGIDKNLASSANPKATLFLAGVIIYGKEKKALFEIRNGNSTMKRQVQEGEKIGGYTLDKVEKEKVVLKHGGRIKTLLLKRGTVETIEEEVKPENNMMRSGIGRGNKTGTSKIERYKPGEIDLSQHKEEVKRGILSIIQAFPNPAGNIDKNGSGRR
jgi:type II secretory pathway component PulC